MPSSLPRQLPSLSPALVWENSVDIMQYFHRVLIIWIVSMWEFAHSCWSHYSDVIMRRRDCLLNRLFGRRSKKTSKLRATGPLWGEFTGPVNSPHKGPVTRKKFPFDDVIRYGTELSHHNACRCRSTHLTVLDISRHTQCWNDNHTWYL